MSKTEDLRRLVLERMAEGQTEMTIQLETLLRMIEEIIAYEILVPSP